MGYESIPGLSRKTAEKLEKAGIVVNFDSYQQYSSSSVFDLLETSLQARVICAQEALKNYKNPIKILEIGPGSQYSPAIYFMGEFERLLGKQFCYTGIDSLGDSKIGQLTSDKKKSIEAEQKIAFTKLLHEEYPNSKIESNFRIGDASNPLELSDEELCNFDVIFLNEFPSVTKDRIISDAPHLAYIKGIKDVWTRLAALESNPLFVIFSREPYEILDTAEWLCEGNIMPPIF